MSMVVPFGKITSLPYMLGEMKRLACSQVPTADPSQMAEGKYRSYGGKLSLLSLLLATHISPVIKGGTGCLFFLQAFLFL